MLFCAELISLGLDVSDTTRVALVDYIDFVRLCVPEHIEWVAYVVQGNDCVFY